MYIAKIYKIYRWNKQLLYIHWFKYCNIQLVISSFIHSFNLFRFCIGIGFHEFFPLSEHMREKDDRPWNVGQ